MASLPAVSQPSSTGSFCTELMKASRKKLLDLSLKNRLLNYAPADPEHRDDGRAHKFLKVGGRFKAVWSRLVEEDKQLRIFRFNPVELGDGLKRLTEGLKKASRAEADIIRGEIREINQEIAEGEVMAQEGHVWVEKLGEEQYQKRLRRLSDEAKSLEDTTGDSAFFLGFGFLKWPEKSKSSRVEVEPAKDGLSTFHFAPLILVKVSLTDEGKGATGRKKFRIVKEDDPQDNQSLKAKLQEQWDFTIPDLAEDSTAADYFASVRRAITLSKLEGFEVQDTLALGFFNFARYRLWLDLDPRQWKGVSPEAHPIVKSILSVSPLDTSCPRIIDATRDDAIADEVARHQESDDIPIIKDADASQYSALLYARKGKSIVVIGPPGSGKSQTITNLVAAMIANGKKVLFVAQKLPALDVVARRIREAGLGEFCLQFYSAKQDGELDRKPVTPLQIHAQLTKARDILGSKPRVATGGRRASVLAKQLNSYSSTIHALHPVYSESLQRILCSALQLKEEAVLAWGDDWDDALLAVLLPDGAALSTKWIEGRSRLIADIARLRHEAGDFWQGWKPDSLTVLDVPRIEAALEEHRRALKSVCEWCQIISPTMVDWRQSDLHDLADSCVNARAPKHCSDEFVRAIACDDLMRLAHEMERELSTSEKAEARGTVVLFNLPEGASATAAFVMQNLTEVERCVQPMATYGDAKAALDQLDLLLGVTDILLETLPLHFDGLAAFAGECANRPTISLIVGMAQMEDGKFRRAPTLLLPALARRLVGDPSLGDEAMIIAERIDNLMAQKKAAADVFSQTARAEKLVSDRLVTLLKEASDAGLGSMAISATKTVETSCREAAETAASVVAFDASIVAAAADAEGKISAQRSLSLAAAATMIGIVDLTPPIGCDPKLINAWADGRISESEARAAATAQERADKIAGEIAVLLGSIAPTADCSIILKRAVAAAEMLGLDHATLAEFAALSADIFRLEQSVAAMIPTLVRLGVPHELHDFQAIVDAANLTAFLTPLPKLSGLRPAKLADRNTLPSLETVIAHALDLRRSAAPGAAKVLEAAAIRIRTCLQAAEAAEMVAGSVNGIRSPSTLRELRAIGAAVPILRAMPALPIGCDAVQMSGEQYAVTIRHLVAGSTKLRERIGALPKGVDYNAIPASGQARATINAFRSKEKSSFRILSGEWRAARSVIASFAHELPMADAVAAYEIACAIRADEEAFATDASGLAALGAYFRGSKTDWTPFLAFAESVESLSRALDGFERNERIVAAWRGENGGINSIANACGQFDQAASECQYACPDLFGSADSPFRPDVPVASAREQAAAVLAKIDGLLASPILALTQARDLPPVATRSVTEVISAASEAEREIMALASAAGSLIGNVFVGSPEDWLNVKSAVDWAIRIHGIPQFASSLNEVMAICGENPDHIIKLAADSQAALTALKAVQGTLSRSRIRPEAQHSTTEFYQGYRECLSSFSPGAGLLLGRPEDGVDTMRESAKLIDELAFELDRSERLRVTVAPNVATTSSVEAALNWALSLASKNAPKNLVAFIAEFPSRAPDVNTFLELCASHSKQMETLRAAGCVGASWLADRALVQQVAEMASCVAEALETARHRAVECGAKAGCTVDQMYVAADAVRHCVLLQDQACEWNVALGCDPFVSENPGDAIRETIFWVESLHTDRIPEGVMTWLVSAHADQRLHWWSSLVRNAKGWRTQRTSIRQSSLPEFDEATLLADWRTQLSSRQTALSLAIEQLARVVKRPEATLVKLRGAADLLRTSSEAASRADVIRAKLPGATTIRTAEDVAENRAYAAWIADRPKEVSIWARNIPVADVCAHLRSLRTLLNEEVVTWQNLAETMESFGKCDSDGPSGMLSESQSLRAALESTENAISNLHGLSSWAALQREAKRASKLGVDRISTQVMKKKATPEEGIAAFKAGVAWQKALIVWKENPNLERFRSARHEETRSEFAQEDIAAVSSQNRQRIIVAMHEKTGGGMASWGNGYIDQLLLHEASKRRKLMPVRRLVESAGKRMQELCPCWLATPAAIAQFMAPGATEFDLIIMDEASQLTPEDSWGAIARGSQIVVVGDPKQMPPSNFFENTAADDDDEEKPESGHVDILEKPQGPILKGHQQESVLKAAEASLPQVWLNWHYRSLHEQLIAAANHLSYDRRLVLFPSSHLSHAHLGIRHTYVHDGTATTGQVKNANEAAAIVNRLAIVAAEFTAAPHRRLAKAPHSVGVIAMNIHQQETIKDLIDLRRNQDPMFGRNLAVLESNETEPFFVRNLENVQGDERDVIIISTTYAPNTPGGTPTQRFFPINQEGGERRFNVLITRAKWRMEVFTSLRSTQLTSAQLGVQHMRSFLEYCESGILPHAGTESGRWFDSPFEAHVHAVLEAKGYSVAKQVGVAGYFLDLAIKDPLSPDRYVLGIECDGATYHSSRAARDRDRLREQVLGERGWDIHRIWSTEWFYNNAAVRKSLFAAVEAALACR